MDKIRLKLKSIRKEKGMTQGDVAGYIGITVASLSRYERGVSELSSERRDKYAECLGYEIRLLLK